MHIYGNYCTLNDTFKAKKFVLFPFLGVEKRTLFTQSVNEKETKSQTFFRPDPRLANKSSSPKRSKSVEIKSHIDLHRIRVG